jgi:hypothetical protein
MKAAAAPVDKPRFPRTGRQRMLEYSSSRSAISLGLGILRAPKRCENIE